MSERVNILFVVSSLGAGGLERQLLTLLRELRPTPFDTAVAVWRWDDDAAFLPAIRDLNIDVYSVDSHAGLFGRLLNLRRLAQRLRPQVIHAYSVEQNLAAGCVGFLQRCLSIGSLRVDYAAWRELTNLPRAFLSMKSPTVVISNSFRAGTDAMHANWLFRPRRIECVPNSIDLMQFPFVSHNFRSQTLELVGVGRLVPQKSWEVTLSALAILKARSDSPWRFRLFGQGPLRRSLEELASELKINAQVEFCGATSRVPEVLASSDILILSSRFEGTPNVVFEAMATGRAVITTDVGDVRQYVRDGIDGFVVNCGLSAPAKIAEHLLGFIENKGRVIAMGHASRERIEASCAPNRLSQETLAVYERCGVHLSPLAKCQQRTSRPNTLPGVATPPECE